MDSEHIHPSRSRVPIIFSVCAVLLILFQLLVLVPEWRLWRSHAPEVYSGQHRGLVFGSLSGILLALAIPLPVFLSSWPQLSKGRRYFLYGLSSTLVLSSLVLLWLRQ